MSYNINHIKDTLLKVSGRAKTHTFKPGIDRDLQSWFDSYHKEFVDTHGFHFWAEVQMPSYDLTDVANWLMIPRSEAGNNLQGNIVLNDPNLGNFDKNYIPENDVFQKDSIKMGYCGNVPNYDTERQANKTTLHDANIMLNLSGFSSVSMPEVLNFTPLIWNQKADDDIKAKLDSKAWDMCKNKVFGAGKCKDRKLAELIEEHRVKTSQACENIVRLEQDAVGALQTAAENKLYESEGAILASDMNKPGQVVPVSNSSSSSSLIIGLIVLAVIGFFVYKFVIKK